MTCPVLTTNDDQDSNQFDFQSATPTLPLHQVSSLTHSHAYSKWFPLLPEIVKSRKSMKFRPD